VDVVVLGVEEVVEDLVEVVVVGVVVHLDVKTSIYSLHT
jgi:hypothetical protein